MKKLLLCFILVLTFNLQLSTLNCAAFFVGFGSAGGADNVVKQGQDAGLIPLTPGAGLPGPIYKTWVKKFGSVGDQGGNCIAVDPRGNVYVTGYCTETVSASYDCIVIKYDSDGNTVWLKFFGSGTGDDGGKGIAVDDTGNVYVAGYLEDSGDYDGFVAKCDPDGHVLWASRYSSGTFEVCRGIALDNTGNVFVAGSTNAGGIEDILLMKYGSAGDTLFIKRLDMAGAQSGIDIAVDQAGNPSVIALISPATQQWLTIKCDPSGDTLWQKIYESGENDFPGGIAVDPSGNIYSTGCIGNDCGVIKYMSSDGETLWLRRYDSGDDDLGLDVAVNSTGSVFMTGATGSGGINDCLTVKYNSSGDRIWAKKYNGGNSDTSYGIAVDNCGYYYVTGRSNNGVDNDIVTIKDAQ